MSFYIYFICFILLFICYEEFTCCTTICKIVDKKKHILYALGIVLIISTIFRAESVGTDLVNYKNNFYNSLNLSFIQFLNKFKYDSGFYFIGWVIGHFSSDFRMVIIVVGFISCFFLLSGIYEQSNSVALSLYLYLCLGNLGGLYNTIRQQLAVLIIFWGGRYLKKTAYLKYIAVVLVASLIHSTAIISLLALIFLPSRIKWPNLIKYGILIVFCILFARYGIDVLVQLYKKNDYSNSIIIGTGKNLLLFYTGIFLLISLKYKKLCKCNNRDALIYYNLFLVGISLQILSIGFSLLTRLTEYFVINLIVLIPIVLDRIKIKSNSIFYTFIVVFIGFLFYIFQLYRDLSGIVPYELFF